VESCGLVVAGSGLCVVVEIVKGNLLISLRAHVCKLVGQEGKYDSEWKCIYPMHIDTPRMSTPIFLYETNGRFGTTPNLDSGRTPCVDGKTMITYVCDLQIVYISFILFLAILPIYTSHQP